MLIDVHVDGCVGEACVQGASRLEKLLTDQLAGNSDCARVHAFLSRDQWMLAKTPPTAKHWTLTVAQSLAPNPSKLTWQLSGPGKNYRGTSKPSRAIKEICADLD
jgi:hypothetical protein